MPTYVYKFTDTGETIEVQQSFTDASLTEAPHPVSGLVMQVKKVFTPVGVSFKGGGFYKTDSRGGSSTTKPAVTPAGEGSSSSGASDGKPATTSSSDSPSSASSSPSTPASTPSPSSGSSGSGSSGSGSSGSGSSGSGSSGSGSSGSTNN